MAEIKTPRVTVIDPIGQEKAKLRVAAYARVSSDSADQLNSYLAQVDYYTRHIGENPNWELADLYLRDCCPAGQFLQHTSMPCGY